MEHAAHLEAKLQAHLSPNYVKVIDDSYKHASHIGYRGKTGSHFLVTIISEKFAELSKIDRHRLIYKTLEAEMKSHIHALAINALTPTEAQAEK